MTRYFSAVHHPWVCLVFLLPLIIIYEGGVLIYAQHGTAGMRGGADEWLRVWLAQYGLGQDWIAPLIIVAVFVVRSIWNWADRPEEPLTVCFGMLLESIGYAGVLWVIARNFIPLMDQLGIPLASVSFQTPGAEMIRYIGAGIYEEVLFRLGLFSGLVFLFRVVLMPKLFAVVLSALISSLIFAVAHRQGAELPAVQFMFLTFAGLFFTLLYVTRGFGIVVGAHAAYDILAGVSVE